MLPEWANQQRHDTISGIRSYEKKPLFPRRKSGSTVLRGQFRTYDCVSLKWRGDFHNGSHVSSTTCEGWGCLWGYKVCEYAHASACVHTCTAKVGTHEYNSEWVRYMQYYICEVTHTLSPSCLSQLTSKSEPRITLAPSKIPLASTLYLSRILTGARVLDNRRHVQWKYGEMHLSMWPAIEEGGIFRKIQILSTCLVINLIMHPPKIEGIPLASKLYLQWSQLSWYAAHALIRL